MEFYLPRTCRELLRSGESVRSRPIADYRSADSYVLLGDPGAGKTDTLLNEAKFCNGHFVTARSFLTFGVGEADTRKTIFIDGLDETRVGGGDSRSPLDRIRAKLVELGRPRFRLSCRDADWLGASDSKALMEVSRSAHFHTLQLEAFTEKQTILFVEHHLGKDSGQQFLSSARSRGLDGLLDNPQTLGLLIDALRGQEWPSSRSETYDLACRQLAREPNTEHRAAQQRKAPRVVELMDAAGYLSSLMLMADRPYVSYDIDDSESVSLRDLISDWSLPLGEALRTRLFKSSWDSHFTYAHRSVAEFLAARFIGRRVDDGVFMLQRILALMVGSDTGVVSGLRGLHAWMAVCCKGARKELIQRDPLGAVLYGDVRLFATRHKLLLLKELGRLAKQHGSFRWQEWSSSPFGALCTADMVPIFEQQLTSNTQEDEHQAIASYILDSLREGEAPPALGQTLITFSRDSTNWPLNRSHALLAYLNITNAPNEPILRLAFDIHTGTVEDEDDELLGILLQHLYPDQIEAKSILDFLHAEKNERLLGTYVMFWAYKLPKASDTRDVATILDAIPVNDFDPENSRHEYIFTKLIGELLARGLEELGNHVTDERLVQWLRTGLNKYGQSTLDSEHASRVKEWLSNNPERYKDVLKKLIPSCIGESNVRYSFYKCLQHLHGADPPCDLGLWLLGQVDNCNDVSLARQLVEEAVNCLVFDKGTNGLSLDYLESWKQSNPEYQMTIDASLHCDIPDWRLEQAQHNAKRQRERAQNLARTVSSLRDQLESIKAGTNLSALRFLANAYFGRYYDCSGDSSIEKLSSIVGNDEELVSAALAGFRIVLKRSDIPAAEDIASLYTENRVYSISAPCLAGALELSRPDPNEILQLDNNTLTKLICFHYVDGAGTSPEWLVTVRQARPEIVASALLTYASRLIKSRAPHVSDLHGLAHDNELGDIARRIASPLLRAFPTNARLNQANQLNYLIQAALQHTEPNELVALVDQKVQLASLSVWQRVYWMCCGALLDARRHFGPLEKLVDNNRMRAQYAASFLYDGRNHDALSNVSTDIQVRLIWLLAPFYSPSKLWGEGFVTPAMNATELVHNLISTLARSTADHVAADFDNMLSDPTLRQWHSQLRYSRFSHNTARREASYQHPTLREVQETLRNREPANPADLAALVGNLLRELATHIRHSDTDTYKLFWNTDRHKKPESPKVEDLCRDALLGMLQTRLNPFGVNAYREGSYADENRADIRVSYGGADGFNVPIEIKRDKHADLWTAIHEQLIQQYTRDPGAAGYGIYVVFWFGGTGMPLPTDGGQRPGSASALEIKLRETLSEAESRTIEVIVFDVESLS